MAGFAASTSSATASRRLGPRTSSRAPAAAAARLATRSARRSPGGRPGGRSAGRRCAPGDRPAACVRPRPRHRRRSRRRRRYRPLTIAHRSSRPLRARDSPAPPTSAAWTAWRRRTTTGVRPAAPALGQGHLSWGERGDPAVELHDGNGPRAVSQVLGRDEGGDSRAAGGAREAPASRTGRRRFQGSATHAHVSYSRLPAIAAGAVPMHARPRRWRRSGRVWCVTASRPAASGRAPAPSLGPCVRERMAQRVRAQSLAARLRARLLDDGEDTGLGQSRCGPAVAVSCRAPPDRLV